MKKVLFAVGSLRKASFNRQLAEIASSMISDRVEAVFLDYQDVPFMNQDIEFPVPDAVERVREEVRNADAIWFFAPEYNYSYPGVLKNLLDWLSRPQVPGGRKDESAIAGKAVTVSSAAGRSAGAGTRSNLNMLFKSIHAKAIDLDETGVSLSKESFETGKLILSDNEKDCLKAQAEALLGFLGA
ncbi:MAG: NADPH-dependent FMN reductase [Candidatus Ornithospirochaeta sp.]|nr:NADPH-dependent FMN reductase [Candidatus Ornithospirochaeta sp.]